MVMLHGDLRDVEDLQRVVNLANAGAVVLCSIHALDVKGAMFNILQSSVFGGSIEVVGPFLRAVMAQVVLAKLPTGLTCLNEFAAFDTDSELQFVLKNGPLRTFRDDADSKIATGVITDESAILAGASKR
jgi:type II secretory ATPase GspE/PulE/Tfp pilus assembly ATPase PilB-like protein